MIVFGQKSVKALALVLFVGFFTSQFALARPGDFPTGPDSRLTPGELCEDPDSYRYAEKIPYCKRDVDSQTKWEIIDTYDHKLGYKIRETGRGEFKIDHYIPLCMGGSNEIENLWPQHKTVYAVTDQMEQVACEKMAQGRLRQAEAVELIKKGKNNLDSVPGIMAHLRGL